MYSFASSTPNGNTKSININCSSYRDSDVGNLFDVVQNNIQDVVYLDDFKFEIPDEILFVDKFALDGNKKSVEISAEDLYKQGKITKDDFDKFHSKENRMWQNILNDILLESLSDDDKKR